jgi:hypothetical protein
VAVGLGEVRDRPEGTGFLVVFLYPAANAVFVHKFHVALYISQSTPFVFLRSVRRLLVTASVVPCSPILVTLIMEALSSSETTILTRAVWHNIPKTAFFRKE